MNFEINLFIVFPPYIKNNYQTSKIQGGKATFGFLLFSFWAPTEGFELPTKMTPSDSPATL
ncbi:MAG: hypothetical protein A2026_11005 [Deltaproteobacteria bacterium RBG_19FT_COMBO_46_12]|nr:MAG: hypothetical protein A2026_11005 [Deltaproteobacteria bacterium RBG_19FT_COMBO_46_12]